MPASSIVLAMVASHLTPFGAIAVMALAVAVVLSPSDSSRGQSPPAGRGLIAAFGYRRRRMPEGSKFAGFFGALEYRRAKGGLELGRIGTIPIKLFERDSVIVFGPTQSYKTSRLVIPAITAFGGAVIATSVKDDIVRATAAARGMTFAWVFDPYGISRYANCYWNPIGPAIAPDLARRLAGTICAPRNVEHATEESTFWYALAARMAEPLLVAASLLAGDLRMVMDWVETRDFTQPAAALADGDCQRLRMALLASLDREERQLSSVITTLEKCLEPFLHGTSVVAGWRNAADFKAEDGETLYLVAPPNRQGEVGPVFSALMRIHLDRVFAQPPKSGLLMVLDEAANIAPIANLDEVVSVIAAYNVQMMTIFQDFSQVRARYGDRASTVVNNHRAKLFLGAISDPETIYLAETLCGSAMPSDARRSHSTGPVSEALLPRGGLRSLRPGDGLLIYGHRDPALLRLRSAPR